MAQFEPALESTTEQTPLVPTQTIGRSDSYSREHSRFSPTTLITPIAIICRLAITLPSATNFRVIMMTSCRLWYWMNDPSSIPPDGHIPDDLCGVDRYFPAIFTLILWGDFIGMILGFSAASFFTSRMGRIPVLLGIIAIGMAGQAFIMGSQFVRGWLPLEVSLFALWAAFNAICNPWTILFILNMYIVDVVQAEDRTVALSKVAGWSTLGQAIALSLGRLFTTQSNTVYLVSLTALALLYIYISNMLPESFPLPKRIELRSQRNDLTRPGSQSWIGRLTESLAIVLEPLKQLKPSYDSSRGRWNWRLVVCAIHIFAVNIANGSAVIFMILYISHHKSNPAKTINVLTTIINLSGGIVLTFVIPIIVRLLRTLYKRIQAPAISLPEDATLNSNDADEAATPSISGQLHEIDPGSSQQIVSETSDHIDVHIIVGSWAIEAIAYIVIGTTTTLATQLFAVVCIGFGAGRTPVFRSLVVASSDPLKQGETLAAIEMVGSLGFILSPMLMGKIATATGLQTIFYVHAAIIAFGASALFLIRDSDRYQGPTSD